MPKLAVHHGFWNIFMDTPCSKLVEARGIGGPRRLLLGGTWDKLLVSRAPPGQQAFPPLPVKPGNSLGADSTLIELCFHPGTLMALHFIDTIMFSNKKEEKNPSHKWLFTSNLLNITSGQGHYG